MDHTPTNFEVADVFEQIAQILEGRGENPFKVRAYRNAVRTLENLTEPVSVIGARGELKKIGGFGDAIAGKTQEILLTGTCELFERLKAEDTAKEAEDAPPVHREDAPPEDGDRPEIESPW
jgi:DNA polymerase/3'-5' exonuclease PolX